MMYVCVDESQLKDDIEMTGSIRRKFLVNEICEFERGCEKNFNGDFIYYFTSSIKNRCFYSENQFKRMFKELSEYRDNKLEKILN